MFAEIFVTFVSTYCGEIVHLFYSTSLYLPNATTFDFDCVISLGWSVGLLTNT